jgi:transcriptional regulator with XRE-family HTH domain
MTSMANHLTTLTKSKFGDSVRELLTEAGISQAELARRLDKSPAYISQTITGVAKPSARWVNLVCDILEIAPERRYELHMDAAMDHGFFQVVKND